MPKIIIGEMKEPKKPKIIPKVPKSSEGLYNGNKIGKLKSSTKKRLFFFINYILCKKISVSTSAN